MQTRPLKVYFLLRLLVSTGAGKPTLVGNQRRV